MEDLYLVAGLVEEAKHVAAGEQCQCVAEEGCGEFDLGAGRDGLRTDAENLISDLGAIYGYLWNFMI